jgi:hypothetical protein
VKSGAITLAHVETDTQGNTPHPKITDFRPRNTTGSSEIHYRHGVGVRAQTHPVNNDDRNQRQDGNHNPGQSEMTDYQSEGA